MNEPHSQSVFDTVNRLDPSPKKENESLFGFFNRTANKKLAHVRGRIETYIQNYPQKELQETIARLRSGNNVQFRSVCFELVLHQSLIRLGFKLTHHPTLSNGSTKKPDFLVTDKNGDGFYLEATLAQEKLPINMAKEKQKEILFDDLNKHPHKNFHIAIEDQGVPNQTLSAKKMINRLNNWLNSLSVDEVFDSNQQSGWDSWEPLELEEDGWKLKFYPIAKDPSSRGSANELIIIYPSKSGVINRYTPIKDAIKGKGNKYGQLDKPLIVAVNVDSMALSENDILEALFGQEIVEFSAMSSRISFSGDGVWGRIGDPKYRRISAAWVFHNCKLEQLEHSNDKLYINPWAKFTTPDSLMQFNCILFEEAIVKSDGISISDLLY